MLLATRILTYNSDEGSIAVRIETSTPEIGKYGWRCTYTINWPHERAKGEAWGHDQIQAILLTLQKIGCEIYASEYHKAGRLRWADQGLGYGFPVPKNGRDMLIGDDLRFFG